MIHNFLIFLVMPELSSNPSADIVKTVATFLSSIAAAIASFTVIVTLTALFDGKRILNIQDYEVTSLLIFVASSLFVSALILSLSCFILSLSQKASTNGFN